MSAQPSAQENAAALDDREFGFWLFLMSDAIVFALLFATYVVLAQGSGAGGMAAPLFDLRTSLQETALLLLSSLSFAFAMLAIDGRRCRHAIALLLIAAALGAGFLLHEIADFRDLIARGLGPERHGAMSALFTLLGAHGLHVALGLLWIVVLVIQLAMRGAQPPVVSRLARLGYYWHFLDIVWIGIYSIVILPALVA